jgi:hypothetical protein
MNKSGVPHVDSIIDDYNEYLLEQKSREPDAEPAEYFEFGTWYDNLYDWRQA